MLSVTGVDMAGMINRGLKSSKSGDWSTPQDFFEKLDSEFHFTLDPCATKKNAKCSKYFSRRQNGLGQPWKGHTVFMNPPYGREIVKWVRKAYESDATVVCLLPARTDTAWWHDYCMKGEVRFIRGRIKFSGHKWNAPFPSAVVIFRKRE